MNHDSKKQNKTQKKHEFPQINLFMQLQVLKTLQ